ncbi:MAG: DUF3164 family protein [Sphaerochaetaceae bacterium]|nr:DUF3164 family protein [Sphaerochaetaceae bacterium]
MKPQVIDGKTYYKNGTGKLVPEELVRGIDQARDELVNAIAERSTALRTSMIDAKRSFMEDIEQFVKVAAAQYGVKLGGERKGNLSLTSYDGSIRITIAMSERVGFTEEIWAAKEILDNLIMDATKDTKPFIKELVSRAFRVKQGSLDSKEILRLRSYEVHDEPQWNKAMEIIDKSRRIESTQPCFRIHFRDADGRFQLLNLDFTTM